MRISVDSRNPESWTPKEHNIIYTEFKSNNIHLVSSSDIYMVMNFITWAELRLVDLIVKRIH